MKNWLLVPVVFVSNFILAVLAFSLSVGMWQFMMSGRAEGLFLYAFLHCLYLILPLACIIAIFSVYVFMMRHPEKYGLSFLSLIISFILFFALVIPFIYSQGQKINEAFNSKEKTLIDDKHLETFIEQPAFIKASGSLLKPFVYDIYEQYKVSYTSYLIFSGSIFLLIFSLWVFTTITEWKIVNFTLLPFLLVLILYAYSYIRTEDFILSIEDFLPFEIPNFWIRPILFCLTSLVFYIYTAILLSVRRSKKMPKKSKKKKIKMPKVKGVKPIKPKKIKAKKEEFNTFIPDNLGSFIEGEIDA
ncbi:MULTISPECIES: hypothetical protein [unclassified Treponema]|uniref:hypothetical protein n=1 Tax=unclassified Treponema TaxID=2638727 RepID=UPI0020A5955D|nr:MULTISPECIES: hypothetical protein [unclassified Treponema]UTC66337.1 hypothetical protein E4O06_10185 [Treponema sp. OMZ 789]UTC69067.1 hypothetical protein E4O01_10330 [Treponema sp. OMZ 790]UTC71779.1 hypothetical protein E4O02_10420 [Treponema sp. OMZ 791]